MKPIKLNRSIDNNIVEYYKILFRNHPQKIETTEKYIKTEKFYQVTFDDNSVFYAQIEEADLKITTELYKQLGINLDLYKPPINIAGIKSLGTIGLHNDSSNDTVTIINVGIFGTELTKTVFHYNGDLISLEYEPGEVIIFNPKINHEVLWRVEPPKNMDYARLSLTLKFLAPVEEFIESLT